MTLVFTQLTALAAELVVGRHRPFPEGDQAIIELHLREAMRGAHLLGPYSQYDWYHPGPLLYYCLTPLYVLSRSATESLYVTAGLVNLVALVLALAVHHTRAREPLARGLFELLFAGAVAAFVWGVPPGALVATPLTEVWNPTVTVIPMLALTVVGAAVASGALTLVPLLVFLHAFVAQTHVSHLLSATVVCVIALTLPYLRGAADRQLHRCWLLIGLGLVLVLWFPPFVAWLAGRYGNASALAHFVLHRHKQLPVAETLTYAVGRLELPALQLLRLAGRGSLSTLVGVGFMLAQLAGVVSCQRRAVRRSAPFASALALTTWAPLPVALLQSTALPSLDPQFYYQSLWYAPIGCLAWYGLAFRANIWLRSRSFGDASWVARAPAVPAVLLIASLWPTLSRDFERCIARGAQADAGSVQAAARSVRSTFDLDVGGKRLALDAPSPDGWGALASIVLELSKSGATPLIHPHWRFMFGSGAHYSGEKAPTLNVGIVGEEQSAPLWRAYGRIGLYTSAFRTPLEPEPLSIRGEHVRGDPARLLRAAEPTEGAAWDGDEAVLLLDEAASVTLTLPLVRVPAVQVVADGNDSYLVQGSEDGLAFRDLGVVPATPAAGLHRREATLDSTVPLRALRIRPGRGDGAFSLARVELEHAAFACALVEARGAAPNPAAVCDGVSPKPNRPRDARGTVILKRAGAELTLALPSAPGLGFLDGILFEGDGNDAYAVDGSRDGVLFSRIGVSAPQPRAGIQRWPFYFNDRSSWSFVRIAPLTGDGFFSLAELRPLVAAGTLVDFAAPATRALLREGWHADGLLDGDGWLSAQAPAARLELSLSAPRAYDVTLRVRLPDDRHESQHVAVEFDQQRVAELELSPGRAREVAFRLPQALVRSQNQVRFLFGSETERGAGPQGHQVVQFRSMLFRPVFEQG
jgi:hypothetical protein